MKEEELLELNKNVKKLEASITQLRGTISSQTSWLAPFHHFPAELLSLILLFTLDEDDIGRGRLSKETWIECWYVNNGILL
jgi:hypothetical protein